MPTTQANPQAAVRPGADHPTYAAAFRCMGPACEDPCCSDWDIPLDKATYERYRQFPPQILGNLVSKFVSIRPAGQPASLYAEIHRTPSGPCPFWDADRLCTIHKQYGPQLLSATCSIYPRSLSRVDGRLEGSLSLSCPEAARNVLLNPGFLEVEGDLHSGAFRTDNCYAPARGGNGSPRKPQSSLAAVRSLLIAMVRDRSRSIERRLLRIGALCQRLQAVVSSAGDAAVPHLLRDCGAGFDAPAELERMPAQPALKLDVLFRLNQARLQEPTCGKRFREVSWSFLEGIAAPEGSAAGSEVERFLHAERTYHRPFFARFPFVLENYLVNSMLQNLFPAGRDENTGFPPRSMFDEFLLMTTQFAWIDTLLVGVAGRYKQAFAAEHVVQVVQSFSREVEHYPPVLNSILETIRHRKLDNLQGMALLLRK